MKKAATAPVTVEKKVGEMSVTFEVSVPYTIPPDGKIQTIELLGSAYLPSLNSLKRA